MRKQIVVRVYGRLWSGARACHQYNVTDAPLTDAEAKRVAGDFESLIDWHVLEKTIEYERTSRGSSRRIDTFRTLRGWRNGFTNKRYDRIVNS